MATSFGTTAPGLVTLRVSLAGEHVKVRVWIGQEGTAALCGELTMTPVDWHQFRALLPEYNPQRMAIHYSDEAWIHLQQAGGD